MKNTNRWNTYITALNQYVTRTGTTRVPTTHIEQVEGGAVNLGAWVGYIRHRKRAGLLSPERQEQLDAIPGWFWDALRPGPVADARRDAEILELRAQGVSLQKIGDQFGLSRQRVHQIVKPR